MGRSYNVVDADSHVLEPPNFWADYIDPAYKDRVPELMEVHVALHAGGGRRPRTGLLPALSMCFQAAATIRGMRISLPVIPASAPLRNSLGSRSRTAQTAR